MSGSCVTEAKHDVRRGIESRGMHGTLVALVLCPRSDPAAKRKTARTLGAFRICAVPHMGADLTPVFTLIEDMFREMDPDLRDEVYSG